MIHAMKLLHAVEDIQNLRDHPDHHQLVPIGAAGAWVIENEQPMATSAQQWSEMLSRLCQDV